MTDEKIRLQLLVFEKKKIIMILTLYDFGPDKAFFKQKITNELISY